MNADELKYIPCDEFPDLTMRQLQHILNITYPNQVQRIIRYYNESRPDLYTDPVPLFGAILTDEKFICPTRRHLLEFQRLQRNIYFFMINVTLGVSLPCWGATYYTDVYFTFPNMLKYDIYTTNNYTLNAKEQWISDYMKSSFTAFAHHGKDPNLEGLKSSNFAPTANTTGLPTWQPYSLAQQYELQIRYKENLEVKIMGRDRVCNNIWDGTLYRPERDAAGQKLATAFASVAGFSMIAVCCCACLITPIVVAIKKKNRIKRMANDYLRFA